MSESAPKILIIGHSFVRLLRQDFFFTDAHFDPRASGNFHLPESGYVTLRGTGGLTAHKLIKYDLTFVQKYHPDIVILELWTNDLSNLAPEVVGSQLDNLARLFRDRLKVSVVGVCQVINHNVSHANKPDQVFNTKAAVLRQYLSVVLAAEPGIFLWEHREFSRRDRALLCGDSIHCNSARQYCLYCSYRGAILRALGLLHLRH